MSKLAIVLCASTIFTLATGASLEKQNETEVLSFDQLIEKFDRRVTDVYEQAFLMPSESIRMNDEIIRKYQNNRINVSGQVLVLLEKIIVGQKARRIKFNETDCLSHFYRFEKYQREVLTEFDKIFRVRWFEIREPLTNLFATKTIESRTSINTYKYEADACKGDACNNLLKDANDLFNEYTSDSKKALDEYLTKLNESEIRNNAETEYQNLIEKASEALYQTLNCTHARFRDYSESVTLKSMGLILDVMKIITDINEIAN